MRYATVMFLLAYYYLTVGVFEWPAFFAVLVAELAVVVSWWAWKDVLYNMEQEL